jgi:hypothetical protein
MQRTADFGNHIAHTFTKHTDCVFDNPATLHTTINMFDPYPSTSQLLIEGFFFIRQAAATWFLEWCNTAYAIQAKCEKAKILQQMTP